MNTTTSIAASATNTSATSQNDHQSALKFITCGSVDDGKSTLIGRLLLDSKSVLQDQLANVSKSGEADLAQFTDGLSAEREQGITIDVAYRYFNTAARKFIIGDAPGHEQYTRNMVTAASSADAAVVLVDATKLQWQQPGLDLLPQTRRHTLLCNLLRVPSIVFAVNKLDALEDAAKPETAGQATLAFTNIREALEEFARAAGIEIATIVPISALKGHNVVDEVDGWCGYHGPSLLDILELLPTTPADTGLPLAFPVQWVEKFSSSADTSQGRRIFWGRVAAGVAQVGQPVKVLPSGQIATVAQVLGTTRKPGAVPAGHSAGIVLDREVDVSRGDWLLALETPVTSTLQADDDFSDTPAPSSLAPSRELSVTVAWMDDEPLIAGRVYWALHGHRWVKARVKRIVHRLDINTLAEDYADALPANSIGHVELLLQEGIAARPFQVSRVLGSLVLVDTASHKTAGAALVN
ncbi:sulfate adenylyltransferase subunit 1 [Rhodoferax lithotrophicus]|uniref:sulfate adenylyltransferase n=1 Tax=Rhodoferax lithotrophicus TaxID=2798804 RepID=A0ABN6D903_9BURK|nr:GTP-binding protein [Rhodoferax sp. MIZ03]BCO28510.1 sulfate adenylyltransferase subunit 1 [Rhodoferax sp. MIZ03]